MKRLLLLATLCAGALALPRPNVAVATEGEPRLYQGFPLPGQWWLCGAECFGAFCCEIVEKPR